MFLNEQINISEFLNKLDYERVEKQKDLFSFLNLILTKEFPHNCYKCNKQLYFSNTYSVAKSKFNFTLANFIKIWIVPNSLSKFFSWNVNISFYCCDCFKASIRGV